MTTQDELQASIEALKDVFGGEPEELDDELADYWEEGDDTRWAMIRHPLVYSIGHSPMMNHYVNQQLRYKQAALQEAEEAGNWYTYIWLHERPYRIDAMLEVKDRMGDVEYWETLARMWRDSENIQQNADTWVELLGSDRGGRESFMSEDDHAALAALPDEFQVWQGHTDKRDDGWSWTTKQETANWFGRRFALTEQARPRVTNGFVRKSDVVAYLLGRGEYEIIVNPRHVHAQVTHWLRKEK